MFPSQLFSVAQQRVRGGIRSEFLFLCSTIVLRQVRALHRIERALAFEPCGSLVFHPVKKSFSLGGNKEERGKVQTVAEMSSNAKRERKVLFCPHLE